MSPVGFIPLTFCCVTVFPQSSASSFQPVTGQPIIGVHGERQLEERLTSSSIKKASEWKWHNKNYEEIESESKVVDKPVNSSLKLNARFRTEINSSLPVLYRIHSTLTRSKDAVWATIALTFICVVLLLAVAQSRMWKDYHGTEMHGVPLPNFNERVPFQDVMKKKVTILKELLSKSKNKKKDETELESLLTGCDVEST